MKRLYVRPDFHRQGIGTSLCKALIEKAGKIGYKHLRLGTALEPAKCLYKSIGFTEIPPLEYVPVEGVVFMELKLE